MYCFAQIVSPEGKLYEIDFFNEKLKLVRDLDFNPADVHDDCDHGAIVINGRYSLDVGLCFLYGLNSTQLEDFCDFAEEIGEGVDDHTKLIKTNEWGGFVYPAKVIPAHEINAWLKATHSAWVSDKIDFSTPKWDFKV